MIDNSNFVPVSPPIYQTSTFEYSDFDDYVKRSSTNSGYSYTRSGNPTVSLLESKLTELENGQEGIVFSSGMGAISSTLLSLLVSGDEIISINTIYGENISFMNNLERYGIKHLNISAINFNDIRPHITKDTKLIYIESPSSQMMKLCDLENIASKAKESQIITVIDNTWASPLFQTPLDFGVDLSIHSLSKYVGGASDLLGGFVVGDNEYIETIRNFGSNALGNSMSPMEAWLFIRSLKTLKVRMNHHNEEIVKVLEFLTTRKEVKKIFHPFCSNSEQKELSKKYLKGYGSLFAIELNTEEVEKIRKFVDSLKLFKIAVSWGGSESLVLPAYKGSNLKQMNERGLNIGHIRLYIGLDSSEELIKDLSFALEKAFDNYRKE